VSVIFDGPAVPPVLGRDISEQTFSRWVVGVSPRISGRSPGTVGWGPKTGRRQAEEIRRSLDRKQYLW
jgi:hypothetical protein